MVAAVDLLLRALAPSLGRRLSSGLSAVYHASHYSPAGVATREQVSTHRSFFLPFTMSVAAAALAVCRILCFPDPALHIIVIERHACMQLAWSFCKSLSYGT
jgi:hypothetical protein